jgi:hypothetical protein
MADPLRPRLDRLEELSKKVNTASDEAVRIVQGVESHLSDTLHIGIRAIVEIDMDENAEEYRGITRFLVYGRHGPKFRFFVIEENGKDEKETILANCTREVKLGAYNALPELLDTLITAFEKTLEQLAKNSKMIQALVPVKGAKS